MKPRVAGAAAGAATLPVFIYELLLSDPWASLFHCKLLAPNFIGGRALNAPGIPLGKGCLENLAEGNAEPLKMRGHAIAGPDS